MSPVASNSSTGWDFADAWFAVAVGPGPRPRTLTEVIAAGDACNHSIFTHAEIEQAVSRLMGSGLLEVTADHHFQLTNEGRRLVARRRGGIFEQAPNALKLLARVPLRPTEWTIEPATVQEAFEQYRQR